MSKTAQVVYPVSDGQRLAETTGQWEAIVKLWSNIQYVADCCVGMDNFVYPVEGDPSTVIAPDVYVALGRKRWPRPCYKVWEEGWVFPQVIMEVLGPSNTRAEMDRRRDFYSQYGAEEYYEFDPVSGLWSGHVRTRYGGPLEPIERMIGFVSPRLNVRFGYRPGHVEVCGTDGRRFLTFQEAHDECAAARGEVTAETMRAENARSDARRRREKLNRLEHEIEVARKRLIAAGIDPD